MSTVQNRALVSLTAPDSFAAEQYQGLRLKLERMRQTSDCRVIAVTSPGAGDGKTVTSINLAGALARGSSARVLLIDADLRRPEIGRHIGVADGDGRGLAEAVADDRDGLGAFVRTVDRAPFSFVPAGKPAMPIHEVLRSPRFEHLLGEARRDYDYVVLDTPPLVPVFDAAVLARAVDGLLIVVAAGRTPRKLLEESLNLLDPAAVLGIVFNGDKRSPSASYGSRYRRYFPN